MPWGDCTGPDGQGPMTGRGRGFYANPENTNQQNNVPGFWARLWGRARGLSLGLGLGFGRRRGRGRGWNARGRGQGKW